MITIQKASPEDIDTIRSIACATWPVAYGNILSARQIEYMLDLFYSPSSLKMQMTEKGHHFILALKENKLPVGFAGYGSHLENQAIFHLHKLYVLPGEQKSHAGSALLQFIEDKLRREGAAEIQLNVNRFNPARIFYEKRGFVILHTEDIDIGQGYYMNDYVMGKKL